MISNLEPSKFPSLIQKMTTWLQLALNPQSACQICQIQVKRASAWCKAGLPKLRKFICKCKKNKVF